MSHDIVDNMFHVAKRIVLLSVIHRKLPVSQAAKQYGVTRAWVYKLLARYREEGRAAFVPASRRPHSNPRATSNHMSQRICQIRMELLREGLDAGPQSISYRLKAERLSPPSIATICGFCLGRDWLLQSLRKSPKPTCSALRLNLQMKPGRQISPTSESLRIKTSWC